MRVTCYLALLICMHKMLHVYNIGVWLLTKTMYFDSFKAKLISPRVKDNFDSKISLSLYEF